MEPAEYLPLALLTGYGSGSGEIEAKMVATEMHS